MSLKKMSVLTLVGLFALFVSAGSGFAGVKTVRLTVPGCSSCGSADRIRSILNWVTGVKEVTVNSSKETVTVTYDEQRTDLQKIKTALKKGGYPVQGDQDFVERE